MRQLAALYHKRRTLLLTLALTGAVLWTFLPAVDNGFVNYDDPDYVTANPHVNQGLSWSSVKWALFNSRAANWHPLTWISHQLDWELFGGGAWGHHLSSILLHTANVLLVFIVLRRLTGAFWRSFLAALFFGLHPLRVESVAWVSERKDVLSTTFFLLAIWTYNRWVEMPRTPVAGRRGAAPVPVMALVFFAFGLMSKPMVVTLPFVLLLLDYWPLGRWSSVGPRRLVMEKMPFFLLASGAGVVTLLAQRGGGAIIEGLPLLSRVENAAVSYWRYLGKLLYPADLAFFYPPVPQWPTLTVVGAALLLVVASVFTWVRRQSKPYLMVGWFWFLGTLVPVSGLVPAGEQSMADRYSYIPSMGILVALIWGAAELTGTVLKGRSEISRERTLRAGALTLVALAGLGSALLTRQQIGYWRNDEALFQHALRATANNYLAHNNLGTTRDKQGRFDEAIEHFEAALRIRPKYAQAHCNLGVVLFEKNQVDEAIAQFEKALKVDPRYADAHHNLGIALERKGLTEQAQREYMLAIRSRPEHADAHYNLGLVLMRQGRLDEAIKEFITTLQLQPGSADAHNNLGFLLQQKGDLDGAIRHYQAAIQFRPEYPRAHFNLGVALYGKGLVEPAIQEFREALRLKPDYVEARKNLEALLQLKKGK